MHGAECNDDGRDATRFTHSNGPESDDRREMNHGQAIIAYLPPAP